MRKPLLITVQGRAGSFGFVFYGDPASIEEWRAEGLDVAEVAYVIPKWVADLGLMRAWCRAQDLWRLVWA